MQNKLLPCPFCSSNNIGYSIKTKGIRANKYHVAMYCKDCNCYGKRTIVDVDVDADREYAFRTDVERNAEYKQIAIKHWNTRKPMERILEQLEEELTLAEKQKEECVFKGLPYYDRTEGYIVATSNAIEIVKGGVDNAG